MSPAEAADLYARTTAGGSYVMWFITVADPAHPGRVVAWARVATVRSGIRLPGELVAGTVKELRTMLPAGLTRRARTALMPPGTVEAWD